MGNFGFGKIHKSGMCCIVRIGKMCYNIDIIWQCRPEQIGRRLVHRELNSHDL